jgi:hypothetical protein
MTRSVFSVISVVKCIFKRSEPTPAAPSLGEGELRAVIRASGP